MHWGAILHIFCCYPLIESQKTSHRVNLAAPNIQIAQQDLRWHLYMDLTLKLNAPNAQIAFGVNAA